MTNPGVSGSDGDRSDDARRDSDEPDRVPTQAELDAEDMAEIARKSKDADHLNRYPGRQVDPGPAPAALTRDAVAWWGAAAAACLVWMIYGFADLSNIESLMQARLEPGLQAAEGVDPATEAASLASFWIPALLIGIPVVMAITLPLLLGIARAHSRSLRSIYIAIVVVTILFTIVGADLLFNYPDFSPIPRMMSWLQCGGLILSVLMTMRRVVSQWLPESMTVRPFSRSR